MPGPTSAALDHIAPLLNPFNTVEMLAWRTRSAQRGARNGAARVIPSRIEVRTSPRISAVVPIEPEHGGLGTPRSLDSTFAGRTVLQRTLERLGAARSLDEIVLLVPDDVDIEPLVQRNAIGARLVIERCGASPFGPRQEAVIAARLWSDTSWRGGIAEACVFDEVLDARVARDVARRRGLDAIVLCGPDWPLVDVSSRTGVDRLVESHRAAPNQRPVVTMPAPPGLAACIVGRDALDELAGGPAMLGALLDVGDAFREGVPPDAMLERSLVRATFDTPRYRLRLRRAVEALMLDHEGTPEAIASRGLDASASIGAIEHQWLQLPTFTPPHLLLELCTGRLGSGSASPHRSGSIQRPPMSLRLVERILAQTAASRDTVLTLGGVGDPLRHPEFDAVVRTARRFGVRGIHVRTELLCPEQALERLAGAEVDVVTVDLHATTPAEFVLSHGVDRFDAVIANIERLAGMRRRRGDLLLPWIVPRMHCGLGNDPGIDRFAARWMDVLGAFLLEPPPGHDATLATTGNAMPARTILREGLRRMTILSDGCVPVSERDLFGDDETVGNLGEITLLDAWRDLFARRRRLRREHGEEAPELRTAGP